nr:PREDICTED: brain-specific angiogenesis inhibitor 1-associated protein 2 [Latimeria chalumnae]|eukprot:XP_014350060.1 PREDICTED: brain-specific angiogenesis inhibitor 1-associated protein 2 [Latimeria chalumnae]
MVLRGPKMSRTDEVHRLTENVYKTIMEQFNPSLRNFISMGKNYEKALTRDVLFQMAEVHRQIQMQLEEMLKSFHNELLTQLEQKVELDARYLSAALKKYQAEQKSKGEALEKCQAELKKLRRKSQGSKTPQKYSDKEMQYVESISHKQSDMDNFTAEGYKTALTEERRRYCFLVEKQCAVAKSGIGYHSKGKEMLTQKIPLWQQSCSDPNRLPERVMQLVQQTAASGPIISSPMSTTKSSLISDPIPGARPLPVPPELAAFVGGGGLAFSSRMAGQDGIPIMNGTTGPHVDDYNHWADVKEMQLKPLSPPQLQRQLLDSYSNTLPVRKSVQPKDHYGTGEGLLASNGERVQSGWEDTKRGGGVKRGWFPFSYTRVLPDIDISDRLRIGLQSGKSSSTGNLLEKEDLSLPPPDYGLPSRVLTQQTASTFKQRPYSMAAPAFSQGLEDYESKFPTRNPFVNVKLKPTVTNDRSAPVLH